jgi:hypothetical protein
MRRAVVPWLLALGLAGLAPGLRQGLPAWWRGVAADPSAALLAPAGDPGEVRGVLRVSLLGEGVGAGERVLHRHTFVNGPGYAGMEDNDIRGFLDGTFKYSVNQPSQAHVRIGRRGDGPRFGEHELFRVLMRWADLRLAAEAAVRSARLELAVEEGPGHPLRLYLYPVRKDWNPGEGGTKRDNASLPRPGEVWWNDLGFGEAPWGLPGAGFASDRHPGADTGESPLATTTWRPGEASVAFDGPGLAGYVEERGRAGLPLLFLLKLSDHEEDRAGSVLTVYSGNHGDSANTARRPRLALEWEGTAAPGSSETELFLEYGHVKSLPPLLVEGARSLAASFLPAPGSLLPTLELRTEGEAGLSPWRPVELPLELPTGTRRAELRVIAAPAPLRLGEPFRATIRDTWIVTGPPSQQELRFTFVSPTGVRHERIARYEGDWRFEVELLPDEIGPWRYVWEEHFTERPFRSAVGGFDVIAESLETVLAALEALEQRLAPGADGAGPESRARLHEQLSRLERAVLRFETPESFHSTEGRAVRTRLNEVRALLGEAVPVPQPLAGLPPLPAATTSRAAAPPAEAAAPGTP